MARPLTAAPQELSEKLQELPHYNVNDSKDAGADAGAAGAAVAAAPAVSPAGAKFCAGCGTARGAGAFCANCGAKFA